MKHSNADRIYNDVYFVNLVTFLTIDRVLEQHYPAKAGKAVPFSIPYWPLAMVTTLSSVLGLVYAPARRWWWNLPVQARAGSAVVLPMTSLIALWSRWELGYNYGREPEEIPPKELIRTGPYLWLRHPMYAAYITQLVANFLVTGNPLWLASVPTAIAFIRRAYESHLHMAMYFKAEYMAYMDQTPDMLHPFDRIYAPRLLAYIRQQRVLTDESTS